MKFLGYFLAVLYAVYLIAFIVGVYDPTPMIIGCALFISALSFLRIAQNN